MKQDDIIMTGVAGIGFVVALSLFSANDSRKKTKSIEDDITDQIKSRNRFLFNMPPQDVNKITKKFRAQDDKETSDYINDMYESNGEIETTISPVDGGLAIIRNSNNGTVIGHFDSAGEYNSTMNFKQATLTTLEDIGTMRWGSLVNEGYKGMGLFKERISEKIPEPVADFLDKGLIERVWGWRR